MTGEISNKTIYASEFYPPETFHKFLSFCYCLYTIQNEQICNFIFQFLNWNSTPSGCFLQHNWHKIQSVSGVLRFRMRYSYDDGTIAFLKAPYNPAHRQPLDARRWWISSSILAERVLGLHTGYGSSFEQTILRSNSFLRFSYFTRKLRVSLLIT